ncbi:MAG: hypothetical protein E6G68_02305 [Actinobacteria bacterium]|nr:MAG: hypothetical protein E6G68_02305 [Actinomycetota bacterium]
MRPRSVAILAARIIALWIGIEAVTLTVSLIAISAQGAGFGNGSFWAVIVARALIAFTLWTRAEPIGNAIARGIDDEAPALAGKTANMHAVAISIVGIIFTTEGFAGLIGTAVSSTEFLGSGFSFPLGAFGSRVGIIIAELVTLGIGLVLLFGAGVLAGHLSRSYPQPDATPPAAPPPTA